MHTCIEVMSSLNQFASLSLNTQMYSFSMLIKWNHHFVCLVWRDIIMQPTYHFYSTRCSQNHSLCDTTSSVNNIVHILCISLRGHHTNNIILIIIFTCFWSSVDSSVSCCTLFSLSSSFLVTSATLCWHLSPSSSSLACIKSNNIQQQLIDRVLPSQYTYWCHGWIYI